MKKTILYLALSSFLIGFSQTNKNFDYEKFSKPNPNNELSTYFNKNVKKKLLKKARFFKGKKNITLSFFVNEQGEPYYINISSYGPKEYFHEIKETFKKYFLEKLSKNNFASKNKYSLQIISKKGNKKVFNCSSVIMVEKPPTCENCKDLKLYEDIKDCLNSEVIQYFLKNANFNILNSIKEEEIELHIQYVVKKSGQLKITKKSNIPLIFLYEADKTISSFPIISEVNHFNNEKTDTFYSFSFSYKKGITPQLECKEIKNDSIYKPSSKNNLSQFFKNNLENNDLKKSNLSRIQKYLTLYFELDKNDKISNIKTNSRSKYLENKIINVFKDYSSEKLNFIEKSVLNKYFIRVLKYEDHRTIVKTDSFVGSEKAPIFPGCENSENFNDLKHCFSKGIQMHFVKKFDADLPNNLGLTKGKKRVFINFIINKNGGIYNVKVKAPHQEIKKEVLKVMKLLPTIEPGSQGGKPVNVKYSIPFTIIVK